MSDTRVDRDLLLNGMKKNNLKLSITSALIFLGAFSLFFISDTKVSAQLQVEDNIVVGTNGSSVLSPSSFVFSGYYSGNYSQKGFTTYFEFKKVAPGGSVISIDLNNLLNEGTQTTSKIVRKGKVRVANDFFISPELNSGSNYYFRAVGYFNDDPSKKFYGGISTINTDFPTGGGGVAPSMPFSVDQNGNIIDYVEPLTVADISSGSTDKSICYLPDILDERTNTCERQVCLNGDTLDDATGHCVTSDGTVLPLDPNAGGGTTTGGGITGGTTTGGGTNYGGNTNSGIRYDFTNGLVVCKTAECGFNDLMTLINRIVNYVLFVLFIPIAAILFAYAGVMMLTSGGEIGKKKKALSVFWNVGLGLVIAVSSWLVIKTILSIVGLKDAFNLFFR